MTKKEFLKLVALAENPTLKIELGIYGAARITLISSSWCFSNIKCPENMSCFFDIHIIQAFCKPFEISRLKLPPLFNFWEKAEKVYEKYKRWLEEQKNL
jgi:hypothetical protein